MMIALERLAQYRYRIDVPDPVLADLQDRLARTRWPIEPEGRPWAYGTSKSYLRDLLVHWSDAYDWRSWESRLNGLAQYRLPVDGHDIHLIVEPGSGPDPIPLLLLNGWPSSFVEFADVIEPLAHPERHGGRAEDGFTIVVPSYPGFGFSSPPVAPVAAREVAGTIRRLMSDILACETYFIHGGDWGAAIGSWMAFDAPDAVRALHLNSAVLSQPPAGLDLDEEERAYLELRSRRLAREGGYQAIQSTKPQTLSYGLTDSPSGLAAWIVEKFQGWVVPGSDEPPPFEMDVLLTNIMIYWLNGINAANWMYCDLAGGHAATLPKGKRVEVPTALFQGGCDLPPQAPDRWVRRSYDLVTRACQPGMGHFPFMEPAANAQVDHLRDFLRHYRPGS